MADNIIHKKTHPLVHQLREIRDGDNRDFLFCEGEKVARELLVSKWAPSYAVCQKKTLSQTRALLKEFDKDSLPVHVLDDSVMTFVSDLQTPPGLIIIAKRTAPRHRPESLHISPLILLLHKQQLPQNAGAMIRTAEGAGVTEIWLTKGTVDPFHPKTIRGSSGSVFRMPFKNHPDLPAAIAELKTKNIKTVAADQDGDANYDDLHWDHPLALVMGAEGTGLSKEEMKLVDHTIRIPMKGAVESLNVSVAAAVCLFEASRQRRMSEKGVS